MAARSLRPSLEVSRSVCQTNPGIAFVFIARSKQKIVILPCPFCGNDDVVVDEVKPNVIAITCDECQMIGPHADLDQSLEVAIQRWNERKS